MSVVPPAAGGGVTPVDGDEGFGLTWGVSPLGFTPKSSQTSVHSFFDFLQSVPFG